MTPQQTSDRYQIVTQICVFERKIDKILRSFGKEIPRENSWAINTELRQKMPQMPFVTFRSANICDV